jgi:hypothetical protein
MRTSITLLAALALAAAGCGSGDSDAASEPATAASTGPYGSYVRTVTAADVARTKATRNESGPHQHAPKPGEVRLVIAKGAEQDVLKVTGDDGFTIPMDITAADGALQLQSYPTKAAFCGPEVAEQATYTYKATADGLVLAPAPPDQCADRDSVLSGTWKKG